MAKFKRFLVSVSNRNVAKKNLWIIWLINQIFMILFTPRADWIRVNIPTVVSMFPELYLYLFTTMYQPQFV